MIYDFINSYWISVRNNVTADTTNTFKTQLSALGTLPTAEEVANSLLSIIDKSTREKEGGLFINVDGTELPW